MQKSTTSPVYATPKICIAPGFHAYTALGRHIERITRLLSHDAELSRRAKDANALEKVLTAGVRRAYRLKSDGEARAHHDVMSGTPIVDTILSLRNHCHGPEKQKLLAHALHEILELEQSDGLIAKLSEVCDRAPRCPSAKKQAFNLLIQHAGKLNDEATRRQAMAAEKMSTPNLESLKRELGMGALPDDEFIVQACQLLAVPLGSNSLSECLRAVYGESATGGVSGSAGVGGLDTREGALERLYSVFGDYLDEHKERAWKSAFEEPARFYFDCCDDGCGRDHVNVHGLNWYLTLLDKGLGFAMPMVADESDGWSFGLADFWAGLSAQAWAHFSDPQNFGKEYTGISALRRGNKSQWITKRVYSSSSSGGQNGQYPHGVSDVSPPSRLAAKIGSRDSSVVKHLQVYADRFAHFFTQPFFVRKCFEALNAESKPEHAGFRHATTTLYAEYRAIHGLEESTLVEHVYDEMITELDIDKVACFLGWCGLLRITVPQQAELRRLKAAADAQRAAAEASAAAAAAAANSSDVCLPVTEEDDEPRRCPICFAISDDVTPIEHLVPVAGDVSSHRMCASCKKGWNQNICPFCREVTTAAELVGFISDFISTVSSSTGDANASAAVLETIQLFEMEHEGQPAVIKRVYKMIAEDPVLSASIDGALKQGKDWPRDMAGVFWRIHCAAEAHELKGLSAEALQRLRRVVAAIWKPFEQASPNDLDPHYHGALYTQALVAWLCAWRSGMATDGLVAVVQRCGRNLVQWKKKTKTHQGDWQRVRERIHAEYLTLSHEPIWTSKDKDPVWQNFFR